MQFGEKLKEARVRSGMTQDTVAKQIGVSRQSLSNWENDRTYPDLASVLKLSDLYGLSLDDLLREDMELRRRMEQRNESVKTFAPGFTILLCAVGQYYVAGLAGERKSGDRSGCGGYSADLLGALSAGVSAGCRREIYGAAVCRFGVVVWRSVAADSAWSCPCDRKCAVSGRYAIVLVR